jgi:hypothetical protein
MTAISGPRPPKPTLYHTRIGWDLTYSGFPFTINPSAQQIFGIMSLSSYFTQHLICKCKHAEQNIFLLCHYIANLYFFIQQLLIVRQFQNAVQRMLKYDCRLTLILKRQSLLKKCNYHRAKDPLISMFQCCYLNWKYVTLVFPVLFLELFSLLTTLSTLNGTCNLDPTPIWSILGSFQFNVQQISPALQATPLRIRDKS